MHYSRPVQWVSMATAVLACVWFSPSLLDPFNIPKLAILMVGSAALLGLLAGTIRHWFKLGEWPVWGSVLTFLIGLSAAALASNQSSYRTLWGAWARNNGWLAYASLAILLLAIAVAFRGREARLGLYALIGAGYVQVLYGLLQTTGNDPVRWSNGYNPILGTVGNPNFASALMGMSAVAMMWLALGGSRNMVTRATNAVFALFAVWLTVRSDSIQGTLAFGAGFAVLLAVWISEESQPAWLRRLLWPYVALGTLGAGIGIWGLTGGGPLSGILFSQNLVNRTYYWRAGWNMFESRPLFGVGLDSYGDYYRLMRIPEQVAVTGAQTVSNAAHSVVFQMLGTGGILFFGGYLLLQVATLIRATSALRKGENRLLIGGLLGCWIAFTLQSLFSIDQLGLTVWGWVIPGLLLAVSYEVPAGAKSRTNLRRRKQPTPSGNNVVLATAVAGVFAIAAVGFVLRPLGYESDLRQVVAYQYDPSTPNPVVQSGIRDAIMDAANEAPDPYWRASAAQKLFQIGATDDAVRFAEAAALEFPNDVTLWNLVAIAYEQTGRESAAISWRERTIYLDPLNADYAKLLESDKVAK